MSYVRALLVGLAGAVVAVVLALVFEIARFWVTFAIRDWAGAGSGGIGAVSSGLLPVLAPAAIGFAAGMWWQWRREKRRRAATGM